MGFLLWKPEEVDDVKVVMGDGVSLFSIPFRRYCPFVEIGGLFLLTSLSSS
jgi:hypothetical protein